MLDNYTKVQNSHFAEEPLLMQKF